MALQRGIWNKDVGTYLKSQINRCWISVECERCTRLERWIDAVQAEWNRSAPWEL